MNSKRPNMKPYFEGRIQFHVHGMLSFNNARVPDDVLILHGDVDSPEIKVTMKDGSVWYWSAGKYASRKVHGCYAPLMPKPISLKTYADRLAYRQKWENA